MADMYSCKVKRGNIFQDAKVTIGAEGLDVSGEKQKFFLNYYEIKDFRLLNYHLFLMLSEEEVEFSMLGLNTEAFFDKLWMAYSERSVESLFVKGNHVMDCEGDYAYREGDSERASKAKVSLYDDCVCILPHDRGARRVAFCFMNPPVIDGFKIFMELDSGERYQVARLGKDTSPFFDRLSKMRAVVKNMWDKRHKELESDLQGRLGDRAASLETFEKCGGRLATGLFSADSDDVTFWMAVIKNGKAAVELLIGESAATYLYEYRVSDAEFESILRHAMEAVGTYREVIYLADENLAEKPLYLMSVERSSHVRALRSMNAGKAAHTSGWEERILNFLG